MENSTNTNGGKPIDPRSSKLSPKQAMIATALNGYRDLYPAYGETLTPATVKLYFRLLDDLDEATLSAALSDAAKTCKVFPTPAHIHECADRINKGNVDLEAEQALAKLDRLVERWGCDRLPEFVGVSERHPDGFRRCPEIGGAMGRALASIGGWRAYAARDERNAPFMRKDIIASYKRLRAAEAQGVQLLGDHAGGELAGEIAAAAEGRTI